MFQALLQKCILEEGFYGGYFFTPAETDEEKLMFNVTNLVGTHEFPKA